MDDGAQTWATRPQAREASVLSACLGRNGGYGPRACTTARDAAGRCGGRWMGIGGSRERWGETGLVPPRLPNNDELIL